MTLLIERLHTLEPAHIAQLSRVLVDCVEGGASVNFVWPFTEHDARTFWERLAPEVRAGERVLLIAHDNGRVLGTVNLALCWQPNQPHRADVTKLLVERSSRRRGVARQLMLELERVAHEAGRTLLTLDTEQGGPAERLYEALGWTRLGVVPGFALGTHGGELLAATFFYKQLPR